MADTAQTASPLFGRLRNTFKSLGDSPVLVSQPPQPVQPTQVTQATQPVVPVTQPVQPEPLSTASKLATLDQVLTEVEQQAAAAMAAAPIASPQPVEPTQVAPAPQPVVPLAGPAPVTPVASVPPQIAATPQAPAMPPIPQPQQPFETRQQNVGLVVQATATAVDQAIYQQQVQLAQTTGATTAKEAFAGTAPVVEAATGVQYVEQESVPEIPPEVSEYLAHVENHANQQPQEIVIAEAQQNIPLAPSYPKQSVIVLPITPDVENEGKRKGPLESIRWLVEWSFKMMKMFSGRIIYREVEQS